MALRSIYQRLSLTNLEKFILVFLIGRWKSVKKNISCLFNYRPDARTSVAMKTFESFVLTYLKSLLSATFDLYQFAYWANRSSVWLLDILAHLERKSAYARAFLLTKVNLLTQLFLPCCITS